MTRVIRRNERLVWAAVVAALATSASWLAVISIALLARAKGFDAPAVLAAGRALVRAAWLMVRHGAAIVPLALLVPGLGVLFVRALRGDRALNGETRHA
ncbi:MAG TPA: hypothetical protein VGK89_00310 [Candidatus Eisenbacteria bacterium]|jgi:hypothetical protein